MPFRCDHVAHPQSGLRFPLGALFTPIVPAIKYKCAPPHQQHHHFSSEQGQTFSIRLSLRLSSCFPTLIGYHDERERAGLVKV